MVEAAIIDFNTKVWENILYYQEVFMKKNKKKLCGVLLAMSMTAGLLAGCGGSGSEDGGAGVNPEGSLSQSVENSAESSFNATGYPIVNEPLTLKVMLCIRDTDSLTDPNSMAVVQELEEKTGIHIEWEVIKSGDWSTKTNLMWSSGEYPDIIICSVGSGVDVEEYGVDQHLVIPIDDKLAEYMPTYTGRIAGEDTDPTSNLVASDGHVYAVGYIFAQNICVEQHFFINQEWLETLHLEMPETLDELTDTLRAFKTQDPNGNGEADEIPLEIGLNADSYGLRWLTPMFGIPLSGSRWIYIDNNGDVQFAPTQEGFRQCMEWLHLLYVEGLTDPEIISQDKNTVETKMKGDNIGMFVSWRLKAMAFDDGVAKNGVMFVPPAPEGTTPCFYRYPEQAKAGAYLTCTNEHVEESLRLLDAMLETETMFSLYYGAEGTGDQGTGWEYDENGMINVTNDGSGSGDIKEYLDVNTMFFAPGNYIYSTYNMPEQRIEKIEYCQAYEEAGVVQRYSNAYLGSAHLSSDQRKEMQLKETDIENAVWENVAEFVSKGVTDESWNAFVKLFEDMGVEEYVQTYQKALDELGIK